MQLLAEIRKELDQCSDLMRRFLEDLLKENEQMAQENAELRARLNQNSNNSSIPPSCERFDKPKSLRGKTGRKQGGQPGHKGKTLRLSETPDIITLHKPCACNHCGSSLSGADVTKYNSRQVVDVEVRRIITEHRAITEQCSVCGKETTASFPQGVEHYLQYGPVFSAIMVCLNQGNYLPFDRLAKVSSDIFRISVSTGTLVRIVRECAKKLVVPVNYIKEQLIRSTLLHCDETGVRVNGKTEWLHTAGNKQFTYVETHDKRGSEATREIGILPAFEGIAVHDGWKAYYKFKNCGHALCNAHILRELNGIIENDKQQWPEDMKKLLLEIKHAVDAAGGVLEPNKSALFAVGYDKILGLAEAENPLALNSCGAAKKRGRKKRSKARNLIDRMKLSKSDILKFMYERDVPFDNNLAERDIRMCKLYQKVSGGFRSTVGNKAFDIIRSYVSSATKQGHSMFKSIHSAIVGNPLFSSSVVER